MFAHVCVKLLFLSATQAYPGEELLLVYDYEFKYGQNFYLCLTEEAKERILHVRYVLGPAILVFIV